MIGGKENLKILIKSVNWIGDAVFMTPSLRGLRERFPASRITVLVNPRVKDIFSRNPDVDELIIYDRKKEKTIIQKWRFLKELRKRKYDIGIAVQPRSYEAALILFFSGARERIGYSHYLRNIFLTKTVKLTGDIKHDVDVFFDVMKPLEVKLERKRIVLNTDKKSDEWADSFMKENSIDPGGLLVGLNPGAQSQAKRWFEDRYAKLADRIVRELGGRVIVFSGPGSEEAAGNVRSMAEEELIDGKSDILQLAALCRKCRVVVSNCTGPAHVAAAVGTPVIVIVGTSEPARTRPYGEGHVTIKKTLPCSPCFRKQCEERTCMKMVTVDEVFKAVQRKVK